MKIMYVYYSKKIPVLLPYTFFFLRRVFNGEVNFLTNKEFPQTDLFKQYNINRIDCLDSYKNIDFYNEYKIHGMRDYADNETIYMDIDIFFENPIFLDIMSQNEDFFSNKFWSALVITGASFFESPPTFGYNGGIIKLNDNVREAYTSASLEMFEKVKPFKNKIPIVDAIAEELVAATFPMISPLGYERGSMWVHLMEPTPDVLKKLQVYKEILDGKNK